MKKKSLNKKLFIYIFLVVTIVISIFLLSKLNYKITSPQSLNNAQLKTQPSLSYSISSSMPFTKVESIPSEKEFKILMVGDVMLARTIGNSMINGKDPFQFVKTIFSKYDLVVANLETNISTPGLGTQTKGKLYTFNAPLISLNFLQRSGIKGVSLANNHTMDFYGSALTDEINHLNDYSITSFGSGNNIKEAFQPKYMNVGNIKISFVAVNDIETWQANAKDNTPGSAFFNEDLLKQELSTARSNSDIVIVFPHWGIEYSLTNSDRQKYFGNFFIDNGADIVVGSHPHVIQNISTYKGKSIYYSLGNFVFDEMPLIPNAGKAMMLEITLKNKMIINTTPIFINLTNEGFPKPVN